MNWQEKRTKGTIIQDCINRNPQGYGQIDMAVMAERFLSEYPQYQGHFDKHIKVRVNKNVRTKMGQAFVAGDITIGAWCVSEVIGRYFCAVSWRNGCVETAVNPEEVTVY